LDRNLKKIKLQLRHSASQLLPLQLIHQVVNQNNIQFVASILRDKLPPELNNKDYFIVELSQTDKLFKIEEK